MVHLGDEVEELVLGVLRSGMIAQGPLVQRLEEEFAALIGVEHVVAVIVLVVGSGMDQAHAGEEHPRLIGVGIDRISVEDASGRRSGERGQDRRGHRRRDDAPDRSRHGASHGITAGTALLMNVSSSSRTA